MLPSDPAPAARRTLLNLFDVDLLGTMAERGYVREQRHPRYPLAILNYTPLAQYHNEWNDVTEQCRGLIYNTETFEIVARPFRKFHNWDAPQAKIYPGGPVHVTDKMDGSLGILYRVPADDGILWPSHRVATRGSFTSEQAEWATRWLIQRYAFEPFDVQDGKTYLFEIIYPANRIVVDYRGYEGLVLLDVLDNETGRSDLQAFDDAPFKDKVERRIRPKFDVNLAHEIRDNEEGFVVYWPFHDYRVKVKGAEYVRLHRIITNCTARTIWEYLAGGKELTDLVERVPDEFMDWVRETAQSLTDQFKGVQQVCRDDFHKIMDEHDLWHRFDREGKKEFALQVKADGHPYAAVLFRMWDDQPYDEVIWKTLRPSADKPFWTEGE